MSKNRMLFIFIILLIVIGVLAVSLWLPGFAAESSNAIVVTAGTVVAMIGTAYLSIPFIAENQGIAGLLIGLGIASFFAFFLLDFIKEHQAKPAAPTLQKEPPPSTQRIPITTPVKAVEPKAEVKAEPAKVEVTTKESAT